MSKKRIEWKLYNTKGELVDVNEREGKAWAKEISTGKVYRCYYYPDFRRQDNTILISINGVFTGGVTFYFYMENCQKTDWNNEYEITVDKPVDGFVLKPSNNLNKAFKHKKTGNIYYVEDIALDCTNGREDEEMVIYKKDGMKFVRTLKEFEEKF